MKNYRSITGRKRRDNSFLWLAATDGQFIRFDVHGTRCAWGPEWKTETETDILKEDVSELKAIIKHIFDGHVLINGCFQKVV